MRYVKVAYEDSLQTLKHEGHHCDGFEWTLVRNSLRKNCLRTAKDYKVDVARRRTSSGLPLAQQYKSWVVRGLLASENNTRNFGGISKALLLRSRSDPTPVGRRQRGSACVTGKLASPAYNPMDLRL